MAKRHWNRVGDLQSMFLRLEELVLANSGEDEFEEVFTLLVAKLWDERRPGERRFKAYSRPEATSAAIEQLLREAERGWPGIVALGTTSRLTPEHLQVCVEALAPHEVLGTDLQVLDGFFEFLVGRAAKGSKGQYFTPRHVVEMCVRMLRPMPEEVVLDPACGSGGFLNHVLSFHRLNGLQDEPLSRYSAAHLWGFDLDERATRVAKAMMIMAGDGAANILRLNSLLKPGSTDLFSGTERSGERGESSLTVEDVLRMRRRRHRGFDVILTNPPFAGEVREESLLNSYELGRARGKAERDVLFVERCVELLRPGGRMAVVLPHNKFAGESFSPLREWLVGRCRIVAVVGLGRNTFLPHTHQKASVLVAIKFNATEEASPDQKIFFAVSERDGKDSKGGILPRPGSSETAPLWDRADHDLNEICTAFDEFRLAERLW